MADNKPIYGYPPWGGQFPKTMAEVHDQALSSALIRIDQLEERVAELNEALVAHMRLTAEALRLLDDRDNPGSGSGRVNSWTE